MKLGRLVGVIFAAVLAISLCAASLASAAAPEFSSTAKLTTTGGTGVLATATESVTCTANSSAGEITGVHKVGKVVVTFTGCTGKVGSGTACSVKSNGSSAGSVVTKTLSGELGSVTSTEAASGVGLLLLPETTKAFVNLEGTCLEPESSTVEGNIAGEASPIKTSSTTGKLIFTGAAGVQSIKSIGILGTTVKPKLTAFGAIAASENTSDAITFSKAIEVT